ncbi:hypothetical protein [Nostoc sp.]|uniref:hypothetical protein n=1 Tax=Nostoc sp. TaxID=1180 RepID=UPI002FFB1A6C
MLIQFAVLAIRIVRFFRRQPAESDTQPVNKIRGKVSHSYRTDPKNRELQGQLLILLKGDVPTAKRLLTYQRKLNPGKSDNWYLEKVIYDLERDRR